MERISKTDHEYAGVKLTAGDRFNVEPQDVQLLLLLERIEPEEGEPGFKQSGTEAEVIAQPVTVERSESRASRRRRI